MTVPPLSDATAQALEAIVGDGLIRDPNKLLVYESDGLTSYRRAPGAVVLPRSTEEVVAVLQVLAKEGIPVVPRGAGTGLSGGSLGGAEAVVVPLPFYKGA